MTPADPDEPNSQPPDELGSNSSVSTSPGRIILIVSDASDMRVPSRTTTGSNTPVNEFGALCVIPVVDPACPEVPLTILGA